MRVFRVRILNHINRRIHLPPALSLTGAERNATETEHHERIREYLGYRLFDPGRETSWKSTCVRGSHREL